MQKSKKFSYFFIRKKLSDFSFDLITHAKLNPIGLKFNQYVSRQFYHANQEIFPCLPGNFTQILPICVKLPGPYSYNIKSDETKVNFLKNLIF